MKMLKLTPGVPHYKYVVGIMVFASALANPCLKQIKSRVAKIVSPDETKEEVENLKILSLPSTK